MPGPDAALKEGTLLEGRYRVDRVVGAGGFGVVYSGWHLVLDCPVAIKVMALADTNVSDRAGRFLDEARTLSRLRHPHIVRVLDAGVSEAEGNAPLMAWLVMEWCGDRTLADDLRERANAPRSPGEVWALMQPLVDAVAAAHASGVVHRDIKPSNIMMVEERPGSVEARLIDFGISKYVGSDHQPPQGDTATTGARVHTPAYAAPEQIAGTRTGPWTDVHALGLVLTEMLVGTRAYGNDVDVSIIVDTQRPTPASLGVDVGAWEPVIARALSLKSRARYADAAAFRDALDESLERPFGVDAAHDGASGALIRSEIAARIDHAETSQIDLESKRAKTLADEITRAPNGALIDDESRSFGDPSPPLSRRSLATAIVAVSLALTFVVALGVRSLVRPDAHNAIASGATSSEAFRSEPAPTSSVDATPAVAESAAANTQTSPSSAASAVAIANSSTTRSTRDVPPIPQNASPVSNVAPVGAAGASVATSANTNSRDSASSSNNTPSPRASVAPTLY